MPNLDTATAWAVAQFWQVTLLAVVVGAVTLIFCRRRPHLAYLLWMLVVIKCLTPPLWSSRLGAFSWAQAETMTVAAAAPMMPPAMQRPERPPLPKPEFSFDLLLDEPADAPAIAPTPAPTPVAVPKRPLRETIAMAVAGIWFAGAVLLALAVLWKWLGYRRLIRDAREGPEAIGSAARELAARLNVRRRVRLLLSEAPVGPAVWGIVRPTVLLPAALVEGRPRESWEPILAHELIHLRRGDVLAGGVQLVAQLAWWFHPLIWWANRQATRQREHACDEETIARSGCTADAYANNLVQVLELGRHMHPLIPLPGVRTFEITTRRLEHILHHPQPFQRRTPAWCWAVAIALAIAVLPGAGLTLEVEDDQRSAHVDERVTAEEDVARQDDAANATDRRQRAIDEIGRLGGYVFADSPGGQLGDGPLGVTLFDGWQGGIDGFRLVEQLGEVTSLWISGKALPDAVLQRLSNLPKLKNLGLFAFDGEAIGGLAELPELERLQIEGDGASDAALACLARLPRLKSLMLTRVRITDEGLRQIGRAGSLRGLLIGTDAITDAGLAHLAGLNGLESIAFTETPIKGTGFAALRGLESLKSIVAIDKVVLSDAGLAQIVALPGLEQLTFDAHDITDDGFAAVADAEKLRRLQVVNLRRPDTGLEHLSGLKQLQLLLVSGPDQRDADPSADAISDAGVRHLRDLTAMRSLILRPTTITDEGLTAIESMTHLQTLMIDGSHLTDAGLASLAGLNKLKSLELSHANMSGSGLRHLAGLDALERLDLAGNPINDQGLANLPALGALERLNLTGTNVTNAGLKQLERFGNLKSLRIEITAVTQAEAEKLKDAIPGLAEVVAERPQQSPDDPDAILSFEITGTLEPAEGLDEADAEDGDRGGRAGQADQDAKGNEVGDDRAEIEQSREGGNARSASEDAGVANADRRQRAIDRIHRLNGVVRTAGGANGDSFWVDLTRAEVGADVVSLLEDLGGVRDLGLDLKTAPGAIVNALNRLPRLTHLRLMNCHDEALAAIPRLASLEIIEVSGRGFGDAALAGLVALSHLRHLDLRSTAVGDEGLKHIGRVQSLRYLSVDSQQVTDRGLAHLAGLSKLEALVLRGTPVTGTGFAALRQLDRLQTVTITGHPQLTDAGLAEIARLPGLQSLYLQVPHVTEAGISALAEAKNLRQLRLLDLRFGDEALDTIGSLDGLRELAITGNSAIGITDEGLAALRELTGLESLTLSGNRVTGRGLKHLADMKALKHLRLSHSDIDDEGLAQLPALEGLEEIDLSGTWVTDAGVPALEKHTGLKALHLTNTRVTEAAIEKLREKLPTLTSVRLHQPLPVELELDIYKADSQFSSHGALQPYVAVR